MRVQVVMFVSAEVIVVVLAVLTVLQKTLPWMLPMKADCGHSQQSVETLAKLRVNILHLASA